MLGRQRFLTAHINDGTGQMALTQRFNQSEKNPEHSTPTNAARNGNEASKPVVTRHFANKRSHFR